MMLRRLIFFIFFIFLIVENIYAVEIHPPSPEIIGIPVKEDEKSSAATADSACTNCRADELYEAPKRKFWSEVGSLKEITTVDVKLHLKNGDRISGNIIEKTATTTIIETQAMGKISIANSHIQKKEEIEARSVKDESDSRWQRKISVGYSQTSGNTEDSQGSGELSISRKTGKDEWTGDLKAYISSSNKKMDAKKFYGMGRYAFSYGDDLKWYNFTKFESEQNQFANINYRLIPSAGVGYWFSDEEEWKLMAEGAIGFEHTNYRDGTKSDNEVILVPRGFFEKKLIENLKISEDITLYPSLSEGGEYRLHSETSLVNPINDQVSWKVSFIDDFNSNPSGSTKKNDYRLISSVDYAF